MHNCLMIVAKEYIDVIWPFSFIRLVYLMNSSNDIEFSFSFNQIDGIIYKWKIEPILMLRLWTKNSRAIQKLFCPQKNICCDDNFFLHAMQLFINSIDLKKYEKCI